MECDFHYCTIKVLACVAGFDANEAEIIAYSSQYVDDAVEHKPITIRNFPEIICPLYTGKTKKFDPVCTAHNAIDIATAIDRNVQRLIYIPFHFIPNDILNNVTTSFDFTTAPDCKFANKIIDNAIKRFKDKPTPDERNRNLIKLGIALHTYADTWAHQFFSGRCSSFDNDIEQLEIKHSNNIIPTEFIHHFFNILPDIGHAEAAVFPDKTHVDFSCIHINRNITNQRNNPLHFTEAAKKIYEILLKLTNKPNNWNNYATSFTDFFKIPKNGKHCTNCNKKLIAQVICENIEIAYDNKLWRQQALQGNTHDWKSLSVQDYNLLNYNYNGDNKWLLFHLEAHEQRNFVIANIPKQLI